MNPTPLEIPLSDVRLSEREEAGLEPKRLRAVPQNWRPSMNSVLHIHPPIRITRPYRK